jgi:hypothetical protein
MSLALHSFLDLIRSRYGSQRFLQGDCHVLALGLQRRFGGELFMLMENEHYVHSLWQDPRGEYWDIEGDQAYARSRRRWGNLALDRVVDAGWIDRIEGHGTVFDTVLYAEIVQIVQEH